MQNDLECVNKNSRKYNNLCKKIKKAKKDMKVKVNTKS